VKESPKEKFERIRAELSELKADLETIAERV
jgi:hypothetical protein